MDKMAEKRALVKRLLEAKQRSGKSFDAIAKDLKVTNAHCAQLFHNQAPLKPGIAEKLAEIVPGIDKNDLTAMQQIPFRCYDSDTVKEPLIHRLHEVMNHYGEGLKAIVNEELGDGVVSAIDVNVTVSKQKGKHGEDRIVINIDGKFLPYSEQNVD